MRASRSLLFGLTLALVLGAARADAFCRSTTCTGDCPRDDDGCKTTGKKLAWPGLCVGFSLQRDGTANLPMDVVRPVIEAAFVAWSDIDCGTGAASIAFSELDDVSCHETRYDDGEPNANVILFQDTQWHYKGEGNTLAKTTVTFDPDTGEILDADIEINHAYNEFTVTDENVVYDLQSIVTHEIGHFIGLDHSPDPDATMYVGYDEGTTTLRTLEPDDIDGLCAVYPAGRGGACEAKPKNGLADACGDGPGTSGGDGGGCAASSGRPETGSFFALGLILLGLGLRRRS